MRAASRDASRVQSLASALSIGDVGAVAMLQRRNLCLFVLLVACSPRVGTQCDIDLARTVAYDPGGSPAYIGQSMLITSCASNGAFCHSDNASNRYGAPYGMNFDPVLADSARFASEPLGAAHLYAAQVASHHFRDDIFGQVVSGAMPPGAIGGSVVAQPYRTYVDASDQTGTAVPSLSSAEGRELLRNWLACGSPVIEARTEPMPIDCMHDSDCVTQRCVASVCQAVGATQQGRAVTTPHWQSIYDTIVTPTCALGPCHSAASASASGELDLSTPAIAYAALVGRSATTASCGTRVVAMHPETSFLVQKLEGTEAPGTCGDPMPIGGMLPADQITVIRTWITNGAMMD